MVVKGNCRGSSEEFDHSDIDGMGFLVSMLIMAFMLDGIYLTLYYFVGLNKLTNFGWAKPLPDGTIRYSYLSWWMLELSSHAFVYFLMFIASCSGASGVADKASDLEDASDQCDFDTSDLGPYDFALFMGFVMIAPMGWGMYYEFQALKKDHGIPANPCSRNSGGETVHSV